MLPVPLCPELIELQRFNAQFPDYHSTEHIGHWAIFFTGFRLRADDSCVTGQWLAWPAQSLSLEDRKAIGRYFYANVPGGPGDGEYHKGDAFPVFQPLDVSEFLCDEGRQRATQLVQDGRVRVLQALYAAGVL